MLNYVKIFIVLFPHNGFINIVLSAEDFSDPKCSGNEQSPINIDTSSVKMRAYRPIQMNPSRLYSADIVNTGHTVRITPEPSSRAIITGGPLNDQRYKLEQIHFHWGPNDQTGSEHQINQRSFPLEMHLVFFNLKYSNFSNAMEQADGLTVMGVLFKATQKDNPNFDFTQTFSQITTYQASTKYDFRGQSYSSLLPISRTNYYTYHGSLTTPPCSESVTWIVFMNQVPISSRQLKSFRSFQDEDGNIYTENYRSVQPSNNRDVFSSFVPSQMPKMT